MPALTRLAASRRTECEDTTPSVEMHAKNCRTLGNRAHRLILKDGRVVAMERGTYEQPVGVATRFFERVVPAWSLLALCEMNEFRNDTQRTKPRDPKMVAMKAKCNFLESSFKPFIDLDGQRFVWFAGGRVVKYDRR